MKNMKSILALLLAVVLCLGVMTACGSKNDAPVEPAAPEQEPAPAQPAAEDDLAYITGNGKMVIGYTVYEPMNFTDDNGEFTGFDTEFAIAVCAILGVEPEFVEINWDTKEVELNAKSIDCIWNGLTIDDERKANMSITVPYVKNAQVLVVKADSDVDSTQALVGKTVVAEVSSAGESQVIGEGADEYLAQSEYIAMNKQTDCLMEVKAGTADAAVLDWTLAKSMIGEGTDYADLKMVDGLELATEEYGIAFRKGSNATEEVNNAIAQLVSDGTLTALAEKYGLSLAPSIAG